MPPWNAAPPAEAADPWERAPSLVFATEPSARKAMRRGAARVAKSASCLRAASRNTTRRPMSVGASTCCARSVPLGAWCLESTAMAFLRLFIACTKSVSSPRNSLDSDSLMAVACFSEAAFAATCFFNAAISVSSSPNLAPRVSISSSSSNCAASPLRIASLFSFSFVSHQQTIFSYMPSSFAASASSCAFILPRSSTTRFAGPK
mmetsp:Transcript_52270/g.145855  ORF Transcript_52270/g.145855 Transcript_52270/m.145855 type:complete len:205 (-) Transcript_52270:249-863(-)